MLLFWHCRSSVATRFLAHRCRRLSPDAEDIFCSDSYKNRDKGVIGGYRS